MEHYDDITTLTPKQLGQLTEEEFLRGLVTYTDQITSRFKKYLNLDENKEK